jgi:hypothetical protein
MLKIPGGIPDSLHNRGSDRIGSWRAKVCQMQKGRPPAREIHKRQLEGGLHEGVVELLFIAPPLCIKERAERRSSGHRPGSGLRGYVMRIKKAFSSQLSAKDQRTSICFNGRLIS